MSSMGGAVSLQPEKIINCELRIEPFTIGIDSSCPIQHISCKTTLPASELTRPRLCSIHSAVLEPLSLNARSLESQRRHRIKSDGSLASRVKVDWKVDPKGL